MSCPCQPFSGAGKGEGFADERHLWPAGYWHIALGEPCPVFGEQVASDDGLAWLDAVCADLEASHYAVGPVDLCAAGFGAPHIRQRLYWMAYPRSMGRGGRGASGEVYESGEEQRPGGLRDAGRMADTDGWEPGNGGLQPSGQFGLQPESGRTRGMDNSLSHGRRERRDGNYALNERIVSAASSRHDVSHRSGPTNGFWRDADWLRCRPEPGYAEGRWRAVEPGQSYRKLRKVSFGQVSKSSKSKADGKEGTSQNDD
ncbi:MAG: DNA cytosine methyltransferase [Janthinobacterium lividum]